VKYLMSPLELIEAQMATNAMPVRSVVDRALTCERGQATVEIVEEGGVVAPSQEPNDLRDGEGGVLRRNARDHPSLTRVANTDGSAKDLPSRSGPTLLGDAFIAQPYGNLAPHVICRLRLEHVEHG
jgi:hypothetical protein